MWRLIFKKNGHNVFSYNVNQSTTLIGRSPECHVVLPELQISRKQAVLYRVTDGFLLKKLGQIPVIISGKEIENKSISVGTEFSIGPWQILFEEIPEEYLMQTQETVLRSLNTSDQSLDFEKSPKSLQSSPKSVRFSDSWLFVERKGRVIHKESLSDRAFTLGAGVTADVRVEGPGLDAQHIKIVPDSPDKITLLDLKGRQSFRKDKERFRQVELEVNTSVDFFHYRLSLKKNLSDTELLPEDHSKFMGLVGATQKMKDLYALIMRVGRSEAPVLILGQSGSGKELVASAVHQCSDRAKKPFVALNCGAISKELIESELFGHEKGAFTGAQADRKGAFEYAQDGTLFLDEIGELSLDLQPKLLRVLETGTFKRVGANLDKNVYCRVVAATHRDLAQMVKDGQFREDLFFRLFVLPIYVPTLSERKADLHLLIEHFLKEFGGGQQQKRISRATRDRLLYYSWPGNVRELKNVLQRAYVMAAGDVIESNHLLFMKNLFNSSELSMTKPQTIEGMEKLLIEQSLRRNLGNKKRMAEELGIARSTLFKKLRQYSLEDLVSEGDDEQSFL